MRCRLGPVAAVGLATLLAACAGSGPATNPTTQSAPTAAVTPIPTIAPTTAGPVEGREVCDLSLGTGRSAAQCEGISFDVSLPETCLTRSCGLIVDIPGGVDRGEDAEANTGMAALGNGAGYVVVQPNTPGDGWNYPVDSGRIRSFLDQLIAILDLDPNRVHIGGHSNGGYMAWVFVCDHADLIASAAPLGAGASTDEHPSCDFDVPGHPSQEVDIFLAHGRTDEVVPFSTAVAQRDLVVSAWSMTKSGVLADEPTYRWTRWTSAQGTVFEFLEFDWSGGMLGGHCYPGVTAEVGCGSDTPVDYGGAAFDFYMAHPKDEKVARVHGLVR